MQSPNAKSFNSSCHRAALLGLLCAGLLAFPPRASAIEDPPGCSRAHGGAGSTSQGGLNFNLGQAHVGDTVSVFPSLGMVSNACKAINATGTVYIATGLLTNFLVDVTLNPGVMVGCPTNALCQPGPYNFTITPGLVGAEVNTPLGAAAGVAKTVRAAENGFGTVLAGDINSQFFDYHTASIQIVTPCLRVAAQPAYLAGKTCFDPYGRIQFRGAVTNCGDITLTNVTVHASRGGAMQLLNPADGLPLPLPVTLASGGYAVFSNSFLPATGEISAGRATNGFTTAGTDTTVIGGPRASVTNTAATVFGICPRFIPGVAVKAVRPAFSGLTPGLRYQLQVSLDLEAWYDHELPFTATDTNMLDSSFFEVDLDPQLFFRLQVVP